MIAGTSSPIRHSLPNQPKLPDSALGPEWAVLELLARGISSEEEARYATSLIQARGFQASELHDQALRHRLLPRLGEYLDWPFGEGRSPLKDIFNAAYREELRAALSVNQYRMRLLREEAARLVTACAKARVNVACTKGIVFDVSLYGGRGIRPMFDIDFMIAPEARGAVSDLMRAHGYEHGTWNHSSAGITALDPKSSMMFRLNPDHLPKFLRPSGDVICPHYRIDFANSFTWTGAPWDVPVAPALENPSFVALPGTDVLAPTLAWPYQFLFTILHLFREAWFTRNQTTGVEVTLSKFADVYALWLAGSGESLDGGFRGTVAKFGIEPPVVWTLCHLDRVFGTDVLTSAGFSPSVHEEWLARARAPGGAELRFEATMRERLASRTRSVLSRLLSA